MADLYKPLMPAKGPGANKGSAPVPTDALQMGAHAALNKASAHKQLVSAVIHLKRESAGKGKKATSYAFKPPRVK